MSTGYLSGMIQNRSLRKDATSTNLKAQVVLDWGDNNSTVLRCIATTVICSDNDGVKLHGIYH